MEIIIKNNNDSVQRVTLFGYNRNFCEQRYGNPKGVEIKIEYGNEYLELITYSAYKPFIIKSFKLETYNNGYKKKDLIILNASKLDANGYCQQFQIKLENRVRIEQQAIIDGNTELFLDIGANCEFTLDIDINETKKETPQDRERKKKLLIIK
jgi:hypothetical protein